MKCRFYNHLILAVVALSMVIAGCKKEEEMSFDVPSQSILINFDRPGSEGSTIFTSENISAVDVISVPEGWEVVSVDMYEKRITVKSPASFDDKEVRSGTITLKVYTPSGESKSVEIYVAILANEDIDFRTAPANCYIATQPNTRYLFDPYTGGENTDVVTSYIELIWQTSADIIKYLDINDEFASFFVEEVMDDNDEPTGKLKPGNALIGGYSESGDLLWTWHIWVTNSNPESDVITLNGKHMMNVNLGADCNSAGEQDAELIERSYGMYYQWGRRTPLVGPNNWNFSLNYDKILYNKENYSVVKLEYVESDATTGSVEWAESNPLAIVLGNKDNGYDWLSGAHNNTLWSVESKSDHDPCPAGWRLPDSSVFAGLTIDGVDDAMKWEEAQGMYGWHLLDSATGGVYFFTAQGRRNYLDGRLDIVNDDAERPIPWSGYYWSVSVAGDDASAMFFDLNSATRTWNGFDAARAMHRANAMPVRCVRE